MALASGNRVRLAYVQESTHGTTPGSPTLATLRATQRNIKLVKNILRSVEVRASRQIADARHGFNRVEGQVGYQLSRADYDDFIRFAMGGTWAAFSESGSPNITFATAGDTITRDAGSWLTDGIRPGDIITVASTTNNNGDFRVLSVTATVITVEENLTDEGPVSATVDVKGERIDIGTTLYTATIERQFLDIGKYEAFRGCAVNQMSFRAEPEAIIGGQFDIVGMSAAAMAGSSVGTGTTDPTTNSPFDSFIAQIYEAGGATAVATGFNFTLNNSRNLQGVIGSRFSPDVFEGDAVINGTLQVFFEDETLYNKFINETESSIWLTLNDVAVSGEFINVVFPRVKFNTADIDPPQRGPIVKQMQFEALESATFGTSMWVQKSNS